MKKDLKNKRLRMLSLMARGVKEKAATEQVEKELGGTADSVSRDWRRRGRWLPDLVGIETLTAMQEIIASMKELLTQAWLTYTNSPDGTAIKVGAYRELRQTIHDMAELFQSVGIVMKVPEKVEITNVNETRILLKRYEAIIHASAERDFREIYPEEQVHPIQAAPPDGRVRSDSETS